MAELTEYESDLVATGLNHWQRLLAAERSTSWFTQATSNTNFNLMSELQSNPSLKADCLGGNSVVLCPVTRPPSQKSVKEWTRAKKLYRELKERKNAKDVPARTKDAKLCAEETTEKQTTLSKEQKMIDAQSEMQDDSECTPGPSKVTSTPRVGTRLHTKTPLRSAIKKSKEITPRNFGALESPDIGASTSKTKSAACDELKTSTPRRRVSFEDDNLPYTPIPKHRRRTKSPSPESFSNKTDGVTQDPTTPSTSQVRVSVPKKLSQRRRTSQIESSLRRILRTSQFKVNSIGL